MPRRLSGVLLLGALSALCLPAAARAGDDPPTEYLGLEIDLFQATLGTNLELADHGELQSSVGTPGQLGLRIWTLHWQLAEGDGADLAFSWTPGELVGGYWIGAGLLGSWEIYGGTAPGLTVRLGDRRAFQLAVSLGVGVGRLWVGYECTGEQCESAPYGLMFSPSLRLRYQTEGLLSYGLGLRAVAWSGLGSARGWVDDLAVLQTFLELGFSEEGAVLEPGSTTPR